MKKVYLLAVAALLLATACKKENNAATAPAKVATPTNGTIITGPTVYGNTFSTQDSLTDISLMTGNNLSTKGFVFYQYQAYTALGENSQSAYFQLATAMQVRNGLPVFLEDLTFSFENGTLYGPYPAAQYIVGTIDLDNKPTLSFSTLRQNYIRADSGVEIHKVSLQDSVLVAQLGYYNLNLGQLSVGGAPVYVKAWFVHPQHSFSIQGYFRDDNGAVIAFTNGNPGMGAHP